MKQASADWETAVKISESNDRINLKNTYFNTARFMEINRNFEKAIEFYEKSDTWAEEIPRMFFRSGEIEQLFQYIEKKDDKALYRWWAQY